MEGYVDEKLAHAWRDQADSLREKLRDCEDKIRKLNAQNEVLSETVDELKRLRNLWYKRSEELRFQCNKHYSIMKKCLPILDPRSKLALKIREVIGE